MPSPAPTFGKRWMRIKFITLYGLILINARWKRISLGHGYYTHLTRPLLIFLCQRGLACETNPMIVQVIPIEASVLMINARGKAISSVEIKAPEQLVSTTNPSNQAKKWLQYTSNQVAQLTSITNCVCTYHSLDLKNWPFCMDDVMVVRPMKHQFLVHPFLYFLGWAVIIHCSIFWRCGFLELPKQLTKRWCGWHFKVIMKADAVD